MKKAFKFLKEYKGKDADMKIDKKLASMGEAFQLIEEAHLAWRNSSQSRITSTSTTTNIPTNGGRVKIIRG